MTEHQLFLFLAEVTVVVVAARLGGELAIRLGVAQVVGELVAGILIGPSLFGKLWPRAFALLFPARGAQQDLLEAMSWLGVIFVVLLAGFDTRLGMVRRVGRAVGLGWAGGFLLPFGLTLALMWNVPRGLIGSDVSRPVFALFVATALSISAVPVIARILMDLNLYQTRVGMVIVSTAVADDIVGWILVALATGLSTRGGIDSAALLSTMAAAAGFLLVAFTAGQWLVRRALRAVNRLRIPKAQITLMLAIVLTGGAVTQAFGLHVVLGAFVAGVIMYRTPWRTRDPEAVSALRQIGMSFFAPFFFAYAGLRVDLTTLSGSALAVAVLGLVLSSLGKLMGGALGARLGGLSWREAGAVGAGRTTRGASGLVIAAIGLTTGILTLPMYAIIVLVAVLTSSTAGPLITAFLGRPTIPDARPAGGLGTPGPGAPGTRLPAVQ